MLQHAVLQVRHARIERRPFLVHVARLERPAVEVLDDLRPRAVAFAHGDRVRPALDFFRHEGRVRAAQDHGRALRLDAAAHLLRAVDQQGLGGDANQVALAQRFDGQAHQVFVPDFDGDVERDQGCEAHQGVGLARRAAEFPAVPPRLDQDDFAYGHAVSVSLTTRHSCRSIATFAPACKFVMRLALLCRPASLLAL